MTRLQGGGGVARGFAMKEFSRRTSGSRLVGSSIRVGLVDVGRIDTVSRIDSLEIVFFPIPWETGVKNFKLVIPFSFAFIKGKRY